MVVTDRGDVQTQLHVLAEGPRRSRPTMLVGRQHRVRELVRLVGVFPELHPPGAVVHREEPAADPPKDLRRGPRRASPGRRHRSPRRSR